MTKLSAKYNKHILNKQEDARKTINNVGSIQIRALYLYD